MNWTTENTLVMLGYIALIWSGIWLSIYLERRTHLLKQVQVVRDRLTQPPPAPRYKTVVQLDSNGGLMSFTCRVRLSIGTHVSADIRGELAPMGPNTRMLGIVVSQEIEL